MMNAPDDAVRPAARPELDDAEYHPTLLKLPVVGLLLYWFAYALVAPVTIYDSHVYNMARLYLIEKGGFFGNHVWNIFAQICYPWAFDALHYPFLRLGAGFDLPSFACFLGILLVVHQTVGRRYGPVTAWWCDLTLLAMPTVVFQATSTKNDLVGVFCVAVWFYALRLWEERRRRVYLLWMAVALAFCAGAKLSGPPVVAVLSLFTLWKLRALPRRRIFEFVGLLALCFLLFGSAETYVNNVLLFGRPLGPPEDIQFHRNVDGLAGGAANFVRYFFGNLNAGVDAANPHSPVARWLTDAGRATLRFLHLHNVGYRRDFNDANFIVLKNGMEASTDYGPAGMLALFTALFLVVTRFRRDPLWQICACGLAALAETCLTVGWMPWNNRFLLLPFVLFGLAFTIFALHPGPWLRTRRALLATLLLYSAVVYPLYSFNRKPSDLVLAVRHGAALETSERPMVRDIVRDLRDRVRAGETAPLLMTAGVGAWTYDVLKLRHLRVLPVPRLTPQTLLAAADRAKTDRLLVLTLEAPLGTALDSELQLLKIYPENDNVLYQWQRPGPASAPTALTEADRHPPLELTTGWFGEEPSPSGPVRWMSAEGDLTANADRAGTLVVSARLRSIVPDNNVDLFVDDRPVGSAPLPDTEWHLRAWSTKVSAGTHHFVLRSRRPGLRPPGDARTLTVCEANLQEHVDP